MSEHQPRRGDKFWDRSRFLEHGRQPNGVIEYVDWEEREVTVRFYDGSIDAFDFDQIEDHYEHYFGGCYMLYSRLNGG